jgi:hypothetical protein
MESWFRRMTPADGLVARSYSITKPPKSHFWCAARPARSVGWVADRFYQPARRFGYLVDGSHECFCVPLGRCAEAAHLSDVLERGRADVVFTGEAFGLTEGVNAATHARDDTGTG